VKKGGKSVEKKAGPDKRVKEKGLLSKWGWKPKRDYRGRRGTKERMTNKGAPASDKQKKKGEP